MTDDEVRAALAKLQALAAEVASMDVPALVRMLEPQPVWAGPLSGMCPQPEERLARAALPLWRIGTGTPA